MIKFNIRRKKILFILKVSIYIIIQLRKKMIVSMLKLGHLSVQNKHLYLNKVLYPCRQIKIKIIMKKFNFLNKINYHIIIMLLQNHQIYKNIIMNKIRMMNLTLIKTMQNFQNILYIMINKCQKYLGKNLITNFLLIRILNVD